MNHVIKGKFYKGIIGQFYKGIVGQKNSQIIRKMTVLSFLYKIL